MLELSSSHEFCSEQVKGGRVNVVSIAQHFTSGCIANRSNASGGAGVGGELTGWGG